MLRETRDLKKLLARLSQIYPKELLEKMGFDDASEEALERFEQNIKNAAAGLPAQHITKSAIEPANSRSACVIARRMK